VVQTVFDFSTGNFYANYSAGQMRQVGFSKPFWNLPGWRAKALNGLVQSVTLGTIATSILYQDPTLLVGIGLGSIYPFGLMVRYFRNRGYKIEFLNGKIISATSIRAESFLAETFQKKSFCAKFFEAITPK
jgi:hypothetical protein